MKLFATLISLVMILTVNVSFAEEHTEGRNNGALYPKPAANLENGHNPAQVKLLEPAFMSSVSSAATLKWEQSPEAENYHLQVATDPNFKWLKVDEHLYNGTTYEMKNLEPGIHYYWRVAATNHSKWAGSTKSFYSQSMFATK